MRPGLTTAGAWQRPARVPTLAGALALVEGEAGVGTGELTRAIKRAQPNSELRVRPAQALPRLRDVTFEGGVFNQFSHGRTAKDSISSLILLGVPGTTVELFNAPDLEDKEGQLDVTAGWQGIVGVSDLHRHPPVAHRGWRSGRSPRSATSSTRSGSPRSSPTGRARRT